MSNNNDNAERIKNLTEVGLSSERITAMLNEGLTLDQIEDFCNNKINDVLQDCMKKILSLVADAMKDYNYFPIKDEDSSKNSKINVKLHEDITDIFLKNDILFKDIEMINQAIVDRLHTVLTNSQTNYNKTRSGLLAKLLGRKLPGDITLLDIDKKYKEINTKKEEK
jgi:hypothetical protein